jgi:hypothetical protein
MDRPGWARASRSNFSLNDTYRSVPPSDHMPDLPVQGLLLIMQDLNMTNSCVCCDHAKWEPEMSLETSHSPKPFF